MPLSASFKAAIDLVDPTILLASVENEPGYGHFEFSYSCSGSTYTIRGGSFVACDHGAVHLLDAMGFMFLGPTQQFWRRNNAALAAGTLPTNLSQTKTQFSMPSSSYGQQYGNAWGAPVGSWRAIIEGNTLRWYDLVGWRHQIYPNGHRQSSVVKAFPSFFAANQHLIHFGPGQTFNASVTTSFKLYAMTEADKEIVATLAAAYLLENEKAATSPLNTYGRTNYDASDGDPNSSDLYFDHAIRVCQKVRAGVAALNTYGYGSFTEFNSYTAKAGIPNAELGVYAYAGHKAKPSFDVRPYIYVGVALNFSPKVTWLPRLAAHRDNSTAIMTRDYLDLHQYTNGMPMNGRRQDRNYPDDYDEYKAVGIKGMQGGDGNGNWLIWMVANRHLNMKLRTGSYTYTQARDDVVNGLFNGDTAVANLYDYWMDPAATFQRFSLYQSMLLVDALADGWYKDYFEQHMVMSFEYLTLPAKPTTPVVGDAYDLALTKHLKHTVGMALQQTFHSYAHLRRLANSNVSGYPHLNFGNVTAPYYTDYYVPTHAEYLAAKAALAPLVSRAADLSSLTLSVMHGITPRVPATAKATAVEILGKGEVAYIGPGTLTISGTTYVEDETGNYIAVPYTYPPVTYGSGINFIKQNDSLTYTPSGGYLFPRAFPTTRIEGGANGDVWAYVPNRCAGAVKAENASRYRFEDQLGTFDVGATTPQNDSRMNNLGPGQVKLVGSSLTGFGMLTNMNEWLSMDATKALLPTAILAEDFPDRCAINKV